MLQYSSRMNGEQLPGSRRGWRRLKNNVNNFQVEAQRQVGGDAQYREPETEDT